MRSDVLATTLDRDTECHECGFTHSGVGRAHVDLELGREDREDLLGRESLGKGVKTSECELHLISGAGAGRILLITYSGRRVLLGILWVLFTSDGQKTLDQRLGQLQ